MKPVVNVQMVLSYQLGLRSIRRRIPELMASGKSQRKPEKKIVLSSNAKERKGPYKKY